MILLNKLSTTYKLSHDDIQIWINIECSNDKLTIKTCDNNDSFRFINSDPEIIRRIGELFITASKLVTNINNK